MELTKAMEKRRSIRSFDGTRKVTKEQLCEMVKAAQLAPSWKNQQTSRYYCAISDGMVEKVRSGCLPPFNANSSKGASAFVVAAFVPGISGFDTEHGAAVNEAGDGWGYYDLGLQNQNLLLKATELGLATLVMGIRDEEALRTALEIPQGQRVVSVIAVGYPAVDPPMPERKELQEIAAFF